MTIPLRMKASSTVSEPSRLEGLSSVVAAYLEEYFKAHEAAAPLAGSYGSGLYNVILQEVERPLLSITLKAAGGNQKKAADILGINRNTLKRKLDEYGIDPSDL